MFIAGGLCFMLLLWLSGQQYPFWGKIILAGLGITAVEFCTGCVVNLWLRLGVWDYSGVRFNFLGQVCLPYTLLWCGLGAIVMGFVMAARRWVFV